MSVFAEIINVLFQSEMEVLQMPDTYSLQSVKYTWVNRQSQTSICVCLLELDQ